MRRSLVVAGAALALTAASAHAQGSSVLTHSSCTIARGGAGVADPCADGSAILFNPAGIAMQPSTLGVGLAGITQERGFTYDRTGESVETDSETTPVPYGYATFRFGERLAAGLGVFLPYGAGISWPLEFEGRYTSYDTDLRNLYIQPTVAFRAAPWLSLGAGLDVVRASIEINQRVDLATTALPSSLAPFPGATFGNLGIPISTDFADAQLAGDGTGFGFHLGAIARFSDRLSVGARYMSKVEVDYEGDATFDPVTTGLTLGAGNPFGLPAGAPLDLVLQSAFDDDGLLADQGLSTSLTLPAQFVVGVAVRPLPALQVLADYQWTGWEKFDEAPIDFESAASPDQTLVLDYQNTDTWRLGAELAASSALALRAGFIFNTAAEREFSVSPLLPEAERNYYTAGIGYRTTGGLGIDVGYQYIDQSSRRGRVRGRAPGLSEAQLQALNVGVYDVDASVLGVTLSYQFGGRR